MGERSWGPHRAIALSGLDENAYLREANSVTLALAMIETRDALKNLDAILGVPGIDGIFIGPSDLSIALSDGAVIDPHSEAVDGSLDLVAATAARAKKIAGAYCANADRALALERRGFRFLAIASDTIFLRNGAGAALKVLKG
jgi:4-hydroxy-2-oxoheptanedioate aldolase